MSKSQKQLDPNRFLRVPGGAVIERALKYRGGRSLLTQDEYNVYLEVLARYCNKERAAAAAGVCRVTFWRLAKENEEFAEAEALAVRMGVVHLESMLIKQATEGVLKPVYYRGDIVGNVRQFGSNNLLIRLLKAYYPEKYGYRQEITTRGAIDKPPTIIKNEADRKRLLEMIKSNTGDSNSDHVLKARNR